MSSSSAPSPSLQSQALAFTANKKISDWWKKTENFILHEGESVILDEEIYLEKRVNGEGFTCEQFLGRLPLGPCRTDIPPDARFVARYYGVCPSHGQDNGHSASATVYIEDRVRDSSLPLLQDIAYDEFYEVNRFFTTLLERAPGHPFQRAFEAKSFTGDLPSFESGSHREYLLASASRFVQLQVNVKRQTWTTSFSLSFKVHAWRADVCNMFMENSLWHDCWGEMALPPLHPELRLAVAMGQHARLGKASPISMLDSNVLQEIVSLCYKQKQQPETLVSTGKMLQMLGAILPPPTPPFLDYESQQPLADNVLQLEGLPSPQYTMMYAYVPREPGVTEDDHHSLYDGMRSELFIFTMP